LNLILYRKIRKINLFLPLIPKGNRLIFQFAPFRVGANKLKNRYKMSSFKVELKKTIFIIIVKRLNFSVTGISSLISFCKIAWLF
jgi:hypothetical protein